MTTEGAAVAVSVQTRLRAGRLGFNSRQSSDGIFSLLRRVHTGSGAHTASYLEGSAFSYPLGGGVRQPGHKFDHHHVVARLRMRGSLPPLLSTSLWRCA